MSVGVGVIVLVGVIDDVTDAVGVIDAPGDNATDDVGVIDGVTDAVGVTVGVGVIVTVGVTDGDAGGVQSERYDQEPVPADDGGEPPLSFVQYISPS